jgi:hypothetical protein
MPRKTTREGKPVNAAGVELKAVRLELAAPDHRQLRVAAAGAGLSMASYVRRLVETHLAELRTAAAPKKGRGLK